MAEKHISGLSSAVEDFRRVRRKAALRAVFGRLRRRAPELLSYEDVIRKLEGKERSLPELREIPLSAIVGSCGRYREFTRDFLPRHDYQEARWSQVKNAVTGFQGVPPIRVYRVSDSYFVQDGNHRVSVAREMGLTHIEAYVTQVATRVPLESGDSPDDLIMKAEYAVFLKRTDIDRLRPEANLRVTAPGKYPILLEHIDVHRYYMGIEQEREISYEEAVIHWYHEVYEPVREIIEEREIMSGFQRRTETDLYLWMSTHQEDLRADLKNRQNDAPGPDANT